MRLDVVIFEDHTAENFRPLSWSVPVYEMRCGLFNLRERLDQTLSVGQGALGLEAVPEIGLLPRGLLQPLQALSARRVGPQAVASSLEGAERVLWLSARFGVRWDLLRTLLEVAAGGTDFAWQDENGILACALAPAPARTLLAHWHAWQQQAEESRCWVRAAMRAPRWEPNDPLSGWQEVQSTRQRSVRTGASGGRTGREQLESLLQLADQGEAAAFSYIWDLVPANGAAITADVQVAVRGGRPFVRDLYGFCPQAEAWPGGVPWRRPSSFRSATEGHPAQGVHGVSFMLAKDVWMGQDVRIDPQVVLDARKGPIVLDRGVRVMPQCSLEGPLYVGPNSLIKSGARIYGETSLGAVVKVAGEVAESIFADFVNKQHDGFIGHAVLGGWVNLGAGTTCSDLKNNYGTVKVDLGHGFIETGSRFVGLLMGEHSKSAIGTLFNTGACVGFSCNVFGSGLVHKSLPNYTWGDPAGPVFTPQKAIDLARTVMARRGVAFTPEHARLFGDLQRHRS